MRTRQGRYTSSIKKSRLSIIELLSFALQVLNQDLFTFIQKPEKVSVDGAASQQISKASIFDDEASCNVLPTRICCDRHNFWFRNDGGEKCLVQQVLLCDRLKS